MDRKQWIQFSINIHQIKEVSMIVQLTNDIYLLNCVSLNLFPFLNKYFEGSYRQTKGGTDISLYSKKMEFTV